ncbi:MAG: hypothetical protein GX220_09580 [Treponema sp.]|nr:hypothetical protein [Treponema sp.]
MDTLNNIIIPTTSLVAIFILIATYPLRKSLQTKKWGALILSLQNRTNKLFAAILSLAPLLTVLLYFRNLGTLQNLVLATVSVLAVELVLRDLILRKRCGVYENALVSDGRIILKDDFVHLPTLEYENAKSEETSNTLKNKARVLQIVTKSKGTIYVGFETTKEREDTVEIVRTWCN